MTRDEIIEMAREAGMSSLSLIDIGYLEKFAALVAAAERKRIAAEFDRRSVYSDGTPSSGWYEPHEPAEIVRSMK